MKFIAKYLKVILAVALVLIAGAVYIFMYLPDKQAFELERDSLNNQVTLLQTTISENLRYADIQPELEPATQAVNESREALYSRFPVELKEEDQIMYVVYLEELFGTEISFSFGTASGIVRLSDGATLGGLTLTVNYSTDYQGYKKMIDYLATDERITSIQYSTMEYDANSDTATGSLTLLCYLLADGRDYAPPEVDTPVTGKPNIFS